MALPWAAVRLIMQVTVNDIEVFGHVINSLESISNLVAQCQLMEVIYLVERKKSRWVHFFLRRKQMSIEAHQSQY